MSDCPCGQRAPRLIPDPFDVDGEIWVCDTCAREFEAHAHPLDAPACTAREGVKMTRTLKDKLDDIDPARRAETEAGADRLHMEYLSKFEAELIQSAEEALAIARGEKEPWRVRKPKGSE